MDAKDIPLAPFNPPPSGVFKRFVALGRTGDCRGCGLPMRGNAMVVPGVAGLHCSVDCVETTLFGTGRCRWCGSKMENTYTSLPSRLCSDDCKANYWAHVRGDFTAALGTGKRLLLWLQAYQPETYDRLVGHGLVPQYDRTAGQERRNRPAARHYKDCLGCGKRFLARRANNTTCSPKCRKQASRRPETVRMSQIPATATPVPA